MTVHQSERAAPSALSAIKAGLSTLLYRSRAHIRPGGEIDGMLNLARERNRRVGITGMLLYENDRFFQWLEGPEQAVTALWDSISADPRHGDIEVVSRGVAPCRMFGQWDMQYLQRQGSSNHFTVIPETLTRPVSELTRLALDGDLTELVALLQEQIAAGKDLAALCGHFFEPIARCLGDWWLDDRCSDLQVTMALWTLQNALRQFKGDRLNGVAPVKQPLRLLAAPQPGETHFLGSMMAGDLFHQAGWAVQEEFPASDQDLVTMVSGGWFDLLCLSLSDCFPRNDRLGAMATTIQQARAASLNPNLLVAVGGRLFVGAPATLVEALGADIAYGSVGEAVARSNFFLAVQRDFLAARGDGGRPVSVGEVILPEKLPPGWFLMRR